MMATSTTWQRRYGECPNGHRVVTDTKAKDGEGGVEVLVYDDKDKPTSVPLEPGDLPGIVAQSITRGNRECPHCPQEG